MRAFLLLYQDDQGEHSQPIAIRATRAAATAAANTLLPLSPKLVVIYGGARRSRHTTDPGDPNDWAEYVADPEDRVDGEISRWSHGRAVIVEVCDHGTTETGPPPTGDRTCPDGGQPLADDTDDTAVAGVHLTARGYAALGR
jgi:hypothetical protein